MVEPIILIEPDEGRQWPIGSTQNITWNSDGTCGIDLSIHLFKNNAWLRTIAQTTDSGTYSWVVSTDLTPGNDYSIKIEKRGDYTCGNWDTWTRKFEITSGIGVACLNPICDLTIKSTGGGGGGGDIPPGYKLVWNDEFNGTTIDTSKWCHEFDCQPINLGIEYLDGQGHLVLDAKSGQPEPLIRSKGEPFGPYGIIDIRAKFADGTTGNKKCINNQIWMASNGWTYEADVATNPASKPKMLHSTLMNRVDGTQHWDGGVNKEFNFNILNIWHTYRFEWTNTYCSFYVEDNGIFYEIYTQTNQFYVPNVAMNLKMALCIGPCDFPGQCDGSNPQATPLLIDYVRFYQK